MGQEVVRRVRGRTLNEADAAAIRREISMADPPNRASIARRVCRLLDWTNAKDEPKTQQSDHSWRRQVLAAGRFTHRMADHGRVSRSLHLNAIKLAPALTGSAYSWGGNPEVSPV